MIKAIIARLEQGHRTMAFPNAPPPAMPDRYRGRPVIDASKCPAGCRQCAEACPTDAIAMSKNMSIDLGKCLFCTDCLDACPADAITYSRDYRLAVLERNDLVVEQTKDQQEQIYKLAVALEEKLLKLFGRSLKLRQVSAGGCNACEADVNVLNTVGWDLSRFGIQLVASPRHADGLLITGPVTENMKLALQKTYDAVAAPKIVIAVGACAISGGPYAGHEAVHDGVESMFPVDLFVPGCPPHPLTILDGMLRLLGKIEESRRV